MALHPEPVDLQVGSRVKLRRRLLGMSQERLAALLGITYQQVQKYERGANRIGSSRLQRLADILGVPVAWFFAPPAPERAAPGLAEAPAAFDFGTAEPVSGEPDPDGGFNRETLELVRAFNRIADPLVRRRLYELARSLGDAAMLPDAHRSDVGPT